MPVLSATDLGHGSEIVLLHGVGLGPETFAELARLLAVDHRVLIIERPGGDGWAVPIDEQAAAVAETMASLRCSGATVVGVSGGATLALALSIRHGGVVGNLVLHEPLIGPLAPALDDRFAAAARQAQRGDAEALLVVQHVVGETTWERLDPSVRARAVEGAPRARAEIPVFAAFAPTTSELRVLRQRRVLVTVGGDSAPERHVAAEILAVMAGASVSVVPDAGNAAHVDAPEAFAALIRGWQPAVLGIVD